MGRRMTAGFACALVFNLLLCSPIGRSLAQSENKIPEDLESSVSRGLHYLAATQTPQGCWSGSYGAYPGIVGLGIMTFLAHGEIPGEGKYGKTIIKAVNYILSKKQSNGLLAGSGAAMYNHGFATLALAEVYGQMPENERVGKALKAATDLIIRAQNSMGGWRYSVGSTSSDITVTGCQMMALRAAANAGMEVPAKTIKAGAEYIRGLACAGGGFGYTSPSGPNTVRSAIGVVVLSLTGYYRHPEVKAGADFLAVRGFESSRRYYALYYTSQAMFQAGGRYWDNWNEANKSMLLTSQGSDGSWSGGSGGPAYSTIMALLSLEINWKLLPIYQR
ncbi:MAG: terpene cyclase/mutase family protein [Planctomycetia bacterium]|nr:terpene cyclase/mutase family protein [Planctomycetia bacterium]